MKILTWNINGIRASKVPLKTLFDSLNADIICLQETKITRDLLDEPIANVEGYNSFFSFSKKRSGYSGVVIYCKDVAIPVSAEEGLSGILTSAGQGTIGCYGDLTSFSDEDLFALDAEGRSILTQHQIICDDGTVKDLVVICVYCPRAAAENEERQVYKLKFYNLLQTRAEALVRAGRHVVIVGDINSCHRPIDHCDPQDEEYFMCHPGRKWLNRFLVDLHDTKSNETNNLIEGEDANDNNLSETEQSEKLFVDTFRFMQPQRRNAFTCWSTMTNARQTNYGTRIDYIFADIQLLKSQFSTCDIMPEVEGSDHCPVQAELKCIFKASQKLPPLCAKFMPEFSGKQQKLSSFFTKLSPSKKSSLPVMQMNITTSKNSGSLKRAGRAAHFGSKSKKIKSDAKSGAILSFFCKKSTEKSERKLFTSENLITLDTAKVVSTGGRTQLTESDSINSRSQNEVNSGETQEPDKAQSQLSSQGSEPPREGSQPSSQGSEPPREGSQPSREGSQPSSQCSEPSREGSEPPREGSEPPREGSEPPREGSTSNSGSQGKLAASWKTLLSGPPPPPKCKGHNEDCVMRTVKKSGPNYGKQFYVCTRGEGHKSNPEARCNFFQWKKR